MILRMKMMSPSKRSNKSLSRRSAQKQPYDLVLIVCEGEKTEPNYLRDLMDYEGLSSVNITIANNRYSDPVSVVECAINTYNERNQECNTSTLFNRVFCVIDRDNHHGFQQAIKMVGEFNKKNNNIITLIRSYPCFEYWYLCHFQYSRSSIRATGGKTESDQYASMLKRHWIQIFGNQYAKNQTGVYQKLAGLVDVAIKNSQRSLNEAKSTDEMNPSSEAHLLVEYLRNLKR